VIGPEFPIGCNVFKNKREGQNKKGQNEIIFPVFPIKVNQYEKNDIIEDKKY
jgi:hypothetical protein